MIHEFASDSRAGAMILAVILHLGAGSSAFAQATARPCAPDADEQPGPACLVAHQHLGALSGTSVYWQLHTFPDLAAALREQRANAVVIVAFGRVWLFTVGTKGAWAAHGTHVAEVGPIPVDTVSSYDAEFLKSTFSRGMQAPIHVHSGPEAFYAVDGDTCLETPDGVKWGQGAGNSMVVRQGPPMLLMAPGPEPRKGFAMVLHDSSLSPTTLVTHWTPKGLCHAKASVMEGLRR
jgi:hypothetical protein